jgi:hypothetical protein
VFRCNVSNTTDLRASLFYDYTIHPVHKINRRCGWSSPRSLCCRIWHVDVNTRQSGHALRITAPARLLSSSSHHWRSPFWHLSQAEIPVYDTAGSRLFPAGPPHGRKLYLTLGSSSSSKVCMADRQLRPGSNKTACTNIFLFILFLFWISYHFYLSHFYFLYPSWVSTSPHLVAWPFNFSSHCIEDSQIYRGFFFISFQSTFTFSKVLWIWIVLASSDWKW